MIFAMPFISIIIGLVIGLKFKNALFLKVMDLISNIVLILLMVTIGANIGANESLMDSLANIGISCFAISSGAIIFSIIITVVFEKSTKLLDDINIDFDDSIIAGEDDENKNYTSPLIWMMPLGIILGILAGKLFLSQKYIYLLDYVIRVCLIIIYIGVGISLGNSSETLKYVKQLGFKILLVPASVLAGSIIGGIVSGNILGLPLEISVISSAGMSYYSVTGAYMSSVFGVEIGTYGFVVNVMREFLTVLFLPLIVKISPGSAIASGGAGDMDTMLLPISKFVKRELSLVTLFNGTVLTMTVPFLLPAITEILNLVAQ